MFGLIFFVILIAICVIVPPLALIIVPFILLSLLTGLFFRSVTKSITGPIGNDVKWSGERIARAIEGPNITEVILEGEDDNSISPALQAALDEKNTTTVVKKKKPKLLKKDNLMKDIDDFLKDEREKPD